MNKGQFGARDLQKQLWKLPIPEYDATEALHGEIAAVGEAAAAGGPWQRCRQQDSAAGATQVAAAVGGGSAGGGGGGAAAGVRGDGGVIGGHASSRLTHNLKTAIILFNAECFSPRVVPSPGFIHYFHSTCFWVSYPVPEFAKLTVLCDVVLLQSQNRIPRCVQGLLS